ncbi:MAG: trimethylamine methyltransferase family protein [Deltaproteobacteria bacterium]|jgi:trimethylamine--corrinoid protein Co-methyltransferase|nr:trimethylamine methyltransferase family protein [Deltaproteobacteria bacterium]
MTDLKTVKPSVAVLSEDQIKEIYHQALRVLEESGVYFEDDLACAILRENGASHKGGNVISIPRKLVDDALMVTPESLVLYSRDGEATVFLEGDNSYFNTGGAAIKQMESDGLTARPTTAKDLVDMARLVEGLAHVALQSTALVPSDVPTEISDSYRVYLLLKHSRKPMLAGAFSPIGIGHIHRLLAAAVGGDAELSARPRAVIDVCPSAPLKWSRLACNNIVDCARLRLPIEFISVPMPGACSSATLSGSVVVHTAELLSGIALAQAVSNNTPVIYGGAPMYFDMRSMSTCLSALEASMIIMAYAQIGKFLKLPVHAYGLLSDAKANDFQAGMEDATSGLLAGLAGVNIISGVGMLEFARITSMEKIVMDNDVAGMIIRLKRGIDVNEETLATDLIISHGPGGDYMGTRHTLKWFKNEPYLPSEVIDRSMPKGEVSRDAGGIQKRAATMVKRILDAQPLEMEFENRRALDLTMAGIMEKYSIKSLPGFNRG